MVLCPSVDVFHCSTLLSPGRDNIRLELTLVMKEQAKLIFKEFYSTTEAKDKRKRILIYSNWQLIRGEDPGESSATLQH